MCLHYLVKLIARVLSTTIPQLIANNMSGCFILKHGVFLVFFNVIVNLDDTGREAAAAH